VRMKPTFAQLRQLIGNQGWVAVQREDGIYYPKVIGGNSWPGLLKKHLDGEASYGTYTIDKATQTTKFLMFDVDDPDDLTRAAEKAYKIQSALVDLGVPHRSTAKEFSGSKGYHVWVLMAKGVDPRKLRHLGKAVLGRVGFSCEVFPKQDKVRDRKPNDKHEPLGNLAKLPGGVHAKSGKRSKFLDPFPRPMSEQVLDRIVGELPPPPAPVIVEGDNEMVCFAHAQAGPPDGVRNILMFQAAVLARRAKLSEENVRMVLQNAWDKMDDPSTFTEEEFENIIESSRESGPICSQLEGSEHHCGEACIANRNRKLNTRPGEFKFGQAGEVKTVQVKSRNGKSLTLEHPDIVQGRVTLK
jgi:hypothetical protein